MCKTGLSAPGRGVPLRPVCETGLSAPGRCVFPPLVCVTGRSAPGRGFSPRPGCKNGASTPGRCVFPRPGCETALSAPGRCVSPPPCAKPAVLAACTKPEPCFPFFPPRPCAAAPPRLSLLSSHALAKRSSYPLPPSLPTFRSVWYRCLRRDETVAAVSNAFRVWWASRLPCACLRGRRCGTAFVFAAFFRLPCAKPALLPTAVEFSLLPAFRSVWSRCLRRDETAVFPWF